MDRRETPANTRVAHSSLRGRVEAETFTEGTPARLCQATAALFDTPGPDRRRDRELVLHEGFRTLETRDGWAFGFAERDGYTGYIRAEALGPDIGPMTHVIATRQSYLAPEPRLKTPQDVEPVSFGTAFRAGPTHENGRWTEVTRLLPGGAATAFVPTAHLRPLDQPETDPVAVAERFLGTPYLWGGNSGFGIDCSGLVQAAFLACGQACPGDSDQQAARLGAPVALDAPVERGDLFFWKGHVAMARDDATLIHANARHMAVTLEPLAAALQRIEATDGPLAARRRVPPPA